MAIGKIVIDDQYQSEGITDMYKQNNTMNLFNAIKNKFISQEEEPKPEPMPMQNDDVRLLKQVNKDKKVVAVIVSFVGGSSYDHLFTSVEQKSEEGTQVLVYSCNSMSIKSILQAFKAESKSQTIKQMIGYIKELDPDCVVFNWQCCSLYSSQSFPEGPNILFEFVKLIIDRGHTAMFSDFSLKALISSWNSKYLGPNPFVKLSEFGGSFQLAFDCNKLRDCPSAQLQIIGQMASTGVCNVQAMSGTIVYGVNNSVVKQKNPLYELQVLTVCSSLKADNKYVCKAGGKEGPAGHVLLKYKSGGNLLTSMGHWIELMKIDTTEKTLFEVAEREYGATEAQKMRMEYNLLDSRQQQNYISKNAVEFVQRQAPCANMSKKARSKY